MATASKTKIAAAALFLAAAPAPLSAEAVRPSDVPLQMAPCDVPGANEKVRCGVYWAPEDRDRPGGRTLPIKVVVVPARNASNGSAPVLYFQGGPGAASTGEADFFLAHPLREDHDIILIDQRGTGEGHRLACPGPGNDADLGSWLESVYQAPYPAQCRASLEKHADLSLYTTPIAMQDFDDVRRALGHDRVNLLGGSYGSRAALIYMKMFGDHVDAAMVMGLVPLEARLPLYHPHGAQRALERVFAECRGDAACSKAFPDPAGDLEQARRQLRKAPASLTMPHPETRVPAQVQFTEQRLLGAIRPMLYSLQMQRQLPLALHRAARGDYSGFAPAAAFARGANQELAAGMALSVTCSEDVARIPPADIDRMTKGAFLGARFVKERVEACAQWPKGRLPRDHFSDFTRPIPVLLMSGSHDPVTPKWMADAYARHFPISRQIVVTSGHSLPPDECIASVQQQLFRTRDVQKVDVGCTSQLSAPPFATQH